MASWKLKVPRPNLSNQLQEPLANKSKLHLNLAFEKLSRDCRESNFFSEKLSFFNQPSTMRFISCSPEILKRESCDSAKSKKVPEISIKYATGWIWCDTESNIDPFYHQILTTTSGDMIWSFHDLSQTFFEDKSKLERPRQFGPQMEDLKCQENTNQQQHDATCTVTFVHRRVFGNSLGRLWAASVCAFSFRKWSTMGWYIKLPSPESAKPAPCPCLGLCTIRQAKWNMVRSIQTTMSHQNKKIWMTCTYPNSLTPVLRKVFTALKITCSDHNLKQLELSTICRARRKCLKSAPFMIVVSKSWKVTWIQAEKSWKKLFSNWKVSYFFCCQTMKRTDGHPA